MPETESLEVLTTSTRFVPLPVALIGAKEIPHGAVRLYALLQNAGNTPEQCFPSLAWISDALSISERSIRDHVNSLEEAGWMIQFTRWKHQTQRGADGRALCVVLPRKVAPKGDRGSWRRTSNGYLLKNPEENVSWVQSEEGFIVEFVRHIAQKSATHRTEKCEKSTTKESKDKDTYVKREEKHTSSPSPSESSESQAITSPSLSSTDSEESVNSEAGEVSGIIPSMPESPESENEIPEESTSTKKGTPRVERTDQATIDYLCELLQDRVEEFRGRRPIREKSWDVEMDLLIRRGVKGYAPKPIPPERVETAINFIFDELSVPNSGGFCWAEQIESPSGLRKKWDKAYEAGLRVKKNKPKTFKTNFDNTDAREEAIAKTEAKLIELDNS